MSGAEDGHFPVDPLRGIVFPNRMRELRIKARYARLMPLAQAIGDIPYIRLSKIERGEVFARPEELRRVAAVIGCRPDDLLVDVDAPGFSVARWAEPVRAPGEHAIAEERFAIMLAAALRAHRAANRDLTIARIQELYGIAPVILSRLENAQRHYGAWNESTRAAVRMLFGQPDDEALAAHVRAEHARGALAEHVGSIDGPAQRLARTRERIAALRAELARPDAGPPLRHPPAEPEASAAMEVTGVVGDDGLVLDRPAGLAVAPPPGLGARAFALRMCRPTLGGALPGQAILFADPDLHPVAGGLAVLREENGLRVLAVTIDRDGRLAGYSLSPPREISFETVSPADLSAVVAARFI